MALLDYDLLDNTEAIKLILNKIYMSEWEVIDRLPQHPRGLNFFDWLFENKMISQTQYNSIKDKIDKEDLE